MASSPHILGLPYHVRCQIFREVGMPSTWGESIDLCPEEDDGQREFQIRVTNGPRSLLFTNRKISQEISSVIYSTNRVFIQYRDQHGLQALCNLRPTSLKSLSHLTLLLNVSSCDDGLTCCRSKCDTKSFRNRCPNLDRHETPLHLSTARGQEVISEWKRIVQLLSSHISSHRLRLHVVCDVADLETAEEIVQPFIEFPLLRSCDLRLGRYPNDDLRNLATKAAHRATGQTMRHSADFFRFLHLPLEIRRHILGYTDLLTPLGEIQWNSKDGFSIRHACEICDGIYGVPDLDDDSFEHYACQFLKCFKQERTGCYCARYHAAFSSHCRCWAPPTPLFLVCRSLLELARSVFFSRNRFVVQPEAGDMLAPETTSPRLEASIFLTGVVPPNQLYQLKFLEIVLPPFDPGYFSASDPAYSDWLQTLEFLQGKFNSSNLTLRIYLQDFPNASMATDVRKTLTQEQGDAILQAYFRLVSPLASLGLPQRLFVHAAWPWYWKNYQIGLSTALHREDLERRLEQSAMGNGYDSSFAGKWRARESQWLVYHNRLLSMGFGDQ